MLRGGLETALVPPLPENIARAAEIIRAGGLVAFPTETVYGLGADAQNPDAVAKVYQVKGRPSDNPLIWHGNALEDFEGVAECTALARRLADAFWPGALTMILNGENGTLAVRVPSHPVARSLLAASGCLIAAPSANISGRPSPTRAAHVMHDLSGKIEMVIDGGAAEKGVESTVVDLHSGAVRLLRPGAVSLEMLRSVAGEVIYEPDAEGEDAKPLSPGMKYKHYSPKAAVLLLVGPPEAVTAKAAEYDSTKTGILRTHNDSPETVARQLFDRLRQFDEDGAELILAEGVSEEGIGLAVMNRLRKAAAEVIYL